MKLLAATAAVWTTTTTAAAAAAAAVSAFSTAPPFFRAVGCAGGTASSSSAAVFVPMPQSSILLLRSTPSSDDSTTTTTTRDDEDDRGFFLPPVEAAADAASSTTTSTSSNNEYAALAPGDVDSVVRIRIGDPSRARKAWKKRRRSGSPLLVPASILDVDRAGMVRRNVVHLLHKYGEDMGGGGTKYDDVGGGSGGGDGVALTVKNAVKLYERDLGGSLMNHAKALGHATVGSLLLSLFDEPYRRETGVELVRNRRENLLLVSSLSLRRARDVASKSALVQFAVPVDEEQEAASAEDDEGGEEASATEEAGSEGRTRRRTSSSSSVPHTGAVKIRLSPDPHDATQPKGKKKPKPRFVDAALSAAVRVSRRDVDDVVGGRVVRPGLELRAFAFGYDPEGDDGSPLLTVTIDRPRGWIREGMKRKARSRREEARRDQKVRIWKRATATARAADDEEETGSTTRTATVSLTDLKPGDGPIKGTVVRLSSRSGAAFLDCGVTRKAGKKLGGGTVRSLGMLRFDDLVRSMTETPAVHSRGEDGALAEEEADVIDSAMALEEEDDEEEEEETTEDVTDLFELTEDGSLSIFDETTGERTVLEEANPNESEEERDEEDDNDDDDIFAGMSPEERFEAISRMLESEEDFYNNNDDDEEEEECSSSPSDDDDGDGDDGYSEPTFLRTGDVIDVYVKAVHPQSGRYSVTLDPPSPAASNRKGKDVKREREAAKRLEKLSAKYGDESGSLEELFSELRGVECEGTVKAASKAARGKGRWYVRPEVEGKDLPVGVATAEEEEADAEDDDDESSSSSSSRRSIRGGDRVLVRLEGIDERRGQIAMTLLKKI